MAGDVTSPDGRKITSWVDKMPAIQSIIEASGSIPRYSDHLLGILSNNSRFMKKQLHRYIMLERWFRQGI